MTEIHCVFEESPERGFIICAVEMAIFTEEDDTQDLRWRVGDALHCHFDGAKTPRLTHSHFTRDEPIAAVKRLIDKWLG
ncbi:hypothetical protein [Methylococcus capsulatus]|uniref:hypothetical protein n=1 Tax=Methylococcus capsulatus TaxID=414 RepID=UPI0002EBD792|nr:hypothetical protein [Methylococcus capsulatus]QXP88540.1 hypothetical protein KW112_05325 [Methylococcus capsulatus]